ncbi:permease [Stakelama tenebrarum]|uniref:Permease n=1 Tax=Stakelama tenebrarum TaxID=2711215 RepID=A0A6G6Y234_9SPHN|nr:permease [Sphingosinithalassobacter tenebrarum]QIG78959.1 permease [Sphingosinithalassobacter tenebrarum]
MDMFLQSWGEAAYTSLGLFWMAFWAFGFGYLISSMIQVFVTRERMQKAMGDAGAKSVALGTGFGFISSSCSFAALATTRSLFTKGAGFIPALAFLLASTNLVVELGIVIAVFLTWQFVVAEYVGGILLILLMWLVVRLTRPDKLIKQAREHARQTADEDQSGEIPDWRKLIRSREGWQKVANRYVMEWRMVWKDVTVGFTVAGIIAAFVPQSFFRTLFVGSGSSDPGLFALLAQALVGPIAAFFTFIGSMGNIPLAAVLYGNGVAFAGIMAFIFSDLVVLPVLRIQAKYYGWKMALYILAVFLVILVAAALILHYGFAAAGLLPDASAATDITQRSFFAVDYTLFLNLIFVIVSGAFLAWKAKTAGFMASDTDSLSERILRVASFIAFFWLAGGLGARLVLGPGG